MRKSELTVLHNEPIAHHIYHLMLHGSLVAEIRAPGQFVYIRCGDGWETLLRRPVSIASWNVEEATMSLIYRVEGQGTKWLADRAAGEVVDILGPLGNGFPPPRQTGQKILLVGGGVGVPPLYGLAQTLQTENPGDIDILLGFASSRDAFLIEEFRRLGQVKVATVDGTFGRQGLVTDFIQDRQQWDLFYTCGPIPMLTAMQTLFSGSAVAGYMSLEQRMGCGIGACLACVYPTTEDTREQVKVCSDGPVFGYEEVAL